MTQVFQTLIFNRFSYIFSFYWFLSDGPFLPQNMHKLKCMCENMLALYDVCISAFGNKAFFSWSQISEACPLT